MFESLGLETVLALIIEYRYLVMVPLILFAQPVVGVAAGVLARLDLFDIPVVYTILVGVALAGDVAWYWIGRRYGERFVARYGRFVGITPPHVKAAKALFLKHHPPILVVSKLVNGLGIAIAVLFTAGMSRVPFGRYMFFNFIGEAVWSAFLLFLGYFFGTLYAEIEDDIGRASLVVLAILLLAGAYGVMRFLQKRFESYVMHSKNGS